MGKGCRLEVCRLLYVPHNHMLGRLVQREAALLAHDARPVKTTACSLHGSTCMCSHEVARGSPQC